MVSLLEAFVVGVAGGTGKQLAEASWKRVAHYLSDGKAEEQFRRNVKSMLDDLDSRIQLVEQDTAYGPAFIRKAFEQPSFRVLLQQAILSSGQSSEPRKHALLAKIILERIKEGNPESILAITSRMACEAVALLTPHQIRALGLVQVLRHPSTYVPDSIKEYFPRALAAATSFRRFFDYVLGVQRLHLFHRRLIAIDLMHMDAIGCIRGGEPDLVPFLKPWKFKDKFGEPTHLEDAHLSRLSEIRRRLLGQLCGIDPTPTGRLIGVYVADDVFGRTTDFQNWER